MRQAASRANEFSGKLLEVGLGTGLALRHYGLHLKVTGIDLSTDMLKFARKRAKKSSLCIIEALLEMDATSLAFPDNYFDIVVASYVLTTVPDPVKVIHELARDEARWCRVDCQSFQCGKWDCAAPLKGAWLNTRQNWAGAQSFDMKHCLEVSACV